MIKNTAGQVIGVQMVSATDGSAFTGSVTVSVTGDGGTQATGSVGSGACAHEGNGYHTYAPAQAETNYDQIAFTFTGSGAIPATMQVYTVAGDAFTRLGAPAGASVSADLLAIDNLVDDLESRLTATRAGYLDNLSAGAVAMAAELAKVPKSDGTATWNATALASLQSEATDALNAYDPPTRAELTTDTNSVLTAVGDVPTNAELTTALTNLDAAVSSRATPAQVLTQAASALATYDPPTNAELEARTPTAAVVARLTAHANAVIAVVIGTGSTTTSIVLDPSTGVNGGAPPSTNDTFNGRVLVITSGALIHQATDITDYVGSTGTLTVTALTGSAAAGVTAVIV